MAIRPQIERRFAQSSPVARYWLAQCEGFRVRGALKGTVEEVVGSVDTQRVEALVVRRAWRRRNIPVAAVDAVVPAARVIVVDEPQGEAAAAPAHRRAHALAAKVTDDGLRVARVVVDVAHGLAVLVAASLVTMARVLLSAAVRSAHVATTAGAHLRAGVRARRQAAAERRRRPSAVHTRPSVSSDGRKLSRAAMLGLGHRVDSSRR